MSTQIYYKCSKALRNLRFDWTQDPEVVLSERLKTIGLEYEYLKTDPELFEGYCRKLYRGLDVEYHQLLDLVVSAHFGWQMNTMLLMLKCGPTDEQTYEQICNATLTSQPNDKYDYITTIKGLECNRETGGWKMLSSKIFV